MRKIDKPTLKVKEVLADCIDNMTDIPLKTELINANNHFENAENEFNEKKLINELYKIPQNQTISNSIDAKLLKSIYTDRLVNKTNKGRKHYDSLFLSAPNGKCPFCSQRIVRTLDHYLPKSKYPLFSIIPINLIPSCSDCNKDKLVDYPTTSENETLHPYYDNVESENWLKTKLLNVNPTMFEYFVSPPTEWNELLKTRIKNHFVAYNLNTLYCVHASEEFENIKLQLTNIYNSGGTLSLKAHLNDCYISRYDANKNSWQTAFYEALLFNDEFTNGKFI